MRILQVVPSLIKGGAERLALNLNEALAKRGHDVLLVALKDDNRYPELSTDRVEVAPSSVYYSLLGKDIIDTSAYEAVVDRFRPDVIHSHLIDAELVSRHRPRKEVAYVTHWHGCPNLTNPVPWRERLNREYVWKWNTRRKLIGQYRACNNHFLCISEFIRNYVMNNLGVNESETTVIHNAIDLNRFKRLGLEKRSGFRLVSIGSLQKNKNHPFLFNVVHELVSRGLDDVHLDVYGEGPEENYLRQRIAELQLQKHITLHGIVSDPEVQLNRAHVLIHSAWHEPFGLIFVEAMACGIPVVSFNTGGPAELIEDGKNGYLVQKDDLSAFCDRIVSLYHDRTLLQELGDQGTAHAANFGLDAYTAELEKLYQIRSAATLK